MSRHTLKVDPRSRLVGTFALELRSPTHGWGPNGTSFPEISLGHNNMDAPLPDPRGNITAASSPFDYYRPVTDPAQGPQRLTTGCDAVRPTATSLDRGFCTVMTVSTALSEGRPPRGATAKDHDRSSTRVHHPTQFSPIPFSPSCLKTANPPRRPHSLTATGCDIVRPTATSLDRGFCTIMPVATTPSEGPLARASTTGSARKGRRALRSLYFEPTGSITIRHPRCTRNEAVLN